MVKKESDTLLENELKKTRYDDHDSTTELAIERYYKLKRPALKIAMVSLVVFICLSGIAFMFMPDAIKPEQIHTTDRMTFILYMSIFIANWLVYFRTKKSYYKHEREGIQSLRRLLGEASKQWQHDGVHVNAQEKHNAFKNKSATSMTVISIQIAVAVLILTLVQNTLYSSNIELDHWKITSLNIAALLAVISFFSFVISIDALDTVFNRYASEMDADVLIHYFYNFTINPKYIGMISMLSAVILTMQVYSAFLASISIAIIMVLGYYLWYPKIDSAMMTFGMIEYDKKRHSFLLKLAKIMFLLFPLLTHVLVS